MGASTSRSDPHIVINSKDNDQHFTSTATATVVTTKSTKSINRKHNIAYFNNAGKTALPPSVKQIGLQSIQNESQPWLLSSSSTTNTQIRQQFSKLINATPSGDDIAIVPSTSFALTLAAHNLYRTGKIQQKDKILILQDEMSSEVYCWQEICKYSGASLDIVPYPNGEGGWTDMIVNKLLQNSEEDEKIKVVCIPQAHWSDGSYINLSKIGAICQELSIILVVDATQTAGIYPIDVRDIKCHIFAASVHKWLLGPHGCSLLYIHPMFHDSWVPLDQHERSRVAFQNDLFAAGWDLMNNSRGYPEKFIKGAAKCDSGGKKNPILLPMVLEGLNIVTNLDLEECQRKLKAMTDEILDRTIDIGLTVQKGTRVGHIIGLRPNEEFREILTPEIMVQIVESLKSQNIFLAVRCGAFRIAPYLNTAKEEIDALVDGLQREIERITVLNQTRDGKDDADYVEYDIMTDWEIIS